MKKRLAAILAGLMVLTLGATSAFAAGSSSASDALTDYFSSAEIDDEAVAIATVTGTATSVTTDEGIVVTEISVGTDTYLEEGVTYYVVVDGEVYEATYSEGVLTIEGYEADGSVEDLVLYAASADAPEDYDETTVIGETTDDDNSDDGDTDDGDSASDGNDSTTSPKTGEASALPLVAAAVLAGVVVCGKKIKFYA